MNIPKITSELIDDRQGNQNNEMSILDKCWKANDACIAKVKIDGHVLFEIESEDKLQYKAYMETIGMVYTLQPGRSFYYENIDNNDIDFNINVRNHLSPTIIQIFLIIIGFRWTICLERQLSPFVWQIFMPTLLMVALSFISFIIPPNCYPGRISLLVTIFLCIINVMTSAMQNSPESNGLNAMNCWFLICLAQVAFASLEYAVIIYFMRFSKKIQN